MGIVIADPHHVVDNLYQHMTTFDPERVALFVKTFKADADAGKPFPSNGHPYPTGRQLPDGSIQQKDGHHRKQAFIILADSGDERFLKFPIEVSPATDEEMLLAVGETALSRKVLTPIAEARFYKELTDKGWKQSAIAERFGKSQPMVSKYLAILNLPPYIQSQIGQPITGYEGQLTVRHAAELARLYDVSPVQLHKEFKHNGEGVWAASSTNPALRPGNILSADQTARNVDRVLRDITHLLADKSWPDDWRPAPPSATNGACAGCIHAKTVLGAPRCTDFACWTEKKSLWQKEQHEKQRQAVVQWSESHGIDAELIIERTPNHSSPPFAKMGPCSPEDCKCLRLAGDQGRSGGLTPCENATDYKFICLHPDKRDGKMKESGAAIYKPELTPELQAEVDGKLLVEKVAHELIDSYVANLTIPTGLDNNIEFAATLSGLTPKGNAASIYRQLIEQGLRKAASHWDYNGAAGGLDPLRLITVIASHSRTYDRVEADGLTWVRATGVKAVTCEQAGCGATDGLFVAFPSKSKVRCLCGHHMMLLRQPNNAPLPGHDTPVPTGIEAPAGHRVMCSTGINNKGIAHFVADGASESRCGQLIKRMSEGAQAATIYTACPTCKALAVQPKQTDETEQFEEAETS